MAELGGMFLAALLAATLIPAQSEAVLVALLISGSQSLWLLLTVATVGNVAGSTVNWVLGRFLIRFSGRKWFPASAAQLDRAARWYGRWGYLSLLGSWLPVVGDPLTLAAGMMREPLWRFLLIVTLAKGGRYLLLTYATLALA